MTTSFKSALVLGIIVCVMHLQSFAQTIGIGVDVPVATLDIRTTAQISSLNIERVITASALFNPTILVNDSSDYGVMELYQLGTTNDAVLAYFQNDGLGLGFWSTNVNTANDDPAAYISHIGTGPGVAVYHGGTGDGIQVYQAGSEDGISILLDDFFNVEDGLQITHLGNGYGLFIDAYYSTDNILNLVETGTGITNFHYANSTNSMEVDRGGLVGTGYDGDGYYFSNTDFNTPTSSGADGYGFVGYTNTQTPDDIFGTVYGAVLAGEEYGVGHGILINHYGSSGRNAEFNTQDGGNTDPTIYASHDGPGSVLYAENTDNTITGTISVAEIIYSGNDNDDHIAVAGSSVPGNGSGVGVYGIGGYVGVYGEEGNAGSIAGVYANGDLVASGTKSFIIDHPEKPETHMLKHFSIESDQVLNMYQGNAVIGRDGRAYIDLPSWFDDININCSYQLTPVGTPVQPWVVEKIKNNRFVIGGKPNTEVSWVVYAHRNDAYVRTHRDKLQAELPKRTEDQGLYLDPASHGVPLEKGIFYRKPTDQGPASKLFTGDLAGNRKALLETIQKRSGANNGNGFRSQTEQPVVPGKALDQMEIRQEIRTWDELH